jgi:ATP-dependent RNA helicase SUPV3L1/SUV3
VRFGAYHVFMPALLKPAPAEIITMLWSLRNDGFDKPGYGEITAALAAGRTSIVTDPSYQRDFYRLGGFRYLGKRAVRIDILERLADLIRPLLQWKPGVGVPPEGVYDGRRFTTTPAMLSILGATPDDMEEILRGLGYRADQVSAEEAESHLEALRSREQVEQPKPEAAGEVASGSETTAAAQTEGTGETPADQAEAATPAADSSVPETAQPVATSAPDSGTKQEETDTQSAPDEAAETQEEPKPVLLWRPGSRNDSQRHRQHQGKRNSQKGGGRKGEPGTRQGRKGPGKAGGKPGQGGKHDKGRHDRRPPRKDKPIDPDSPFAKLAALKEQLSK